jgi:hypothetical protein
LEVEFSGGDHGGDNAADEIVATQGTAVGKEQGLEYMPELGCVSWGHEKWDSCIHKVNGFVLDGGHGVDRVKFNINVRSV